MSGSATRHRVPFCIGCGERKATRAWKRVWCSQRCAATAALVLLGAGGIEEFTLSTARLCGRCGHLSGMPHGQWGCDEPAFAPADFHGSGS